MVSNTPTGAYCASVQDLSAFLDFNETARNLTQIKQSLAKATDDVTGRLNRDFFPVTETRYFDWPSDGAYYPWRLWLDGNELVSLSALTAGGTTISTANVFLEPNASGPPFDRIEVNVGTTAVFQAGQTWQRAIAITGVWAYSNLTQAVATLSSGINASVTSMTISDSSQIGIGNALLVDSEYFVVTGRSLSTTSQTLQTPLIASAASTSVAVTSGGAYVVGESIVLDSEQMLIVDIASNNLIVRRAYNGSVLAAHTGSTLFAPRSLTVTRGNLGSVAASHSSSATVSLHLIPPAVQSLCLAEAGWTFQGNASAWQTATGDSGRNQPALKNLLDLRESVGNAYGRRARTRHV